MAKNIAIEVIDSGILSDYMPYMTNEEIYGCDTGKYVGLGAYDEKNKKVLGLCIVEVLPEFILIHNLMTVSGQDASVVEKSLLDFIKEDPMLPVHIFVPKDDKDECKKMKGYGFTEEESDCYYMEGRLSDMKDIPAPDPKTLNMKVTYISQHSEEELLPFIMNSPHDRFLQIPWDGIDNDRFGEGIVCSTRNKISAVLLCEDSKEKVEIPWFHGISEQTCDACFYVLKNIYSREGDDDTCFRFLCSKSNQKDLPDKYFAKMKKSEICLFKLS